jgi:hypothetical protein
VPPTQAELFCNEFRTPTIFSHTGQHPVPQKVSALPLWLGMGMVRVAHPPCLPPLEPEFRRSIYFSQVVPPPSDLRSDMARSFNAAVRPGPCQGQGWGMHGIVILGTTYFNSCSCSMVAPTSSWHAIWVDGTQTSGLTIPLPKFRGAHQPAAHNPRRWHME